VSPSPRTARLVLAGILAATAVLRLSFLHVPLERDEGEYAYVAQLMLRGEVPYVAAANMKLPGIYAAYAAILAVLGETPVAIRGALVVVNLVAVWLVARIGRVLGGDLAGLVAAAGYAALSLSSGVLGFTANAEHFVLVPALLGTSLLAPAAPRTTARLLAAGLCMGLAYVTKQHAVAFVLFGALETLRGARRHGLPAAAGGLAAYGVGAATPFLLVCLAMWLAGGFAQFWFWTVSYARQYVSFIPPAEGAAAFLSEARHVIGAAWPLWLLAVPGLTAPAWHPPARRGLPFVALFTVCSALTITPGLRFSEHYWMLLLPAVALLGGLGVQSLADRLAPDVAGAAAWRRAALAVGLPAVAVAGTLAHDAALHRMPPEQVSRAVYGANPFPEATTIGAWLRDHAAPDDRIAVIGSEPEIYFHAGRRAATAYLYTYPMMEPQAFARRMQEEMIAQIEAARPRFLVLVNVPTSWSRRPGSDPLLLDWALRTAEATYRPVGLAEIRPDGPTAWYWGDAAADRTPATPWFVVVLQRRE
jgi:hypothetical protein